MDAQPNEWGLRFEDGKLHLDGFPDCAKFLALKKQPTKELSDLALALKDANFSISCQEKLDSMEDSIIKQALWNNAIIYFLRVFDNDKRNARKGFEPEVIFEGREDAKRAFEHFRLLRNKHIVHDENELNNCYVGAVLNKEDAPCKIEIILAIPHNFVIYNDTSSRKDLWFLTLKTKEWLTEEYNRIATDVSSALEALEYSVLFNMNDVKFVVKEFYDFRDKRE